MLYSCTHMTTVGVKGLITNGDSGSLSRQMLICDRLTADRWTMASKNSSMSSSYWSPRTLLWRRPMYIGSFNSSWTQPPIQNSGTTVERNSWDLQVNVRLLLEQTDTLSGFRSHQANKIKFPDIPDRFLKITGSARSMHHFSGWLHLPHTDPLPTPTFRRKYQFC